MDRLVLVRRMDDLGRIAIPKAIRNAFNLDEEGGEPFEIWVEDDKIILKKYQEN
jgi:transcriptional pleiotropic regulator of transition state genes